MYMYIQIIYILIIDSYFYDNKKVFCVIKIINKSLILFFIFRILIYGFLVIDLLDS